MGYNQGLPVALFANYNFKWWTNEQLSKEEKNWEETVTQKPWYKCCTKNKLAADPYAGIYYDDHGTHQSVTNNIIKHYESHGYSVEIRDKIRAGYLVAGCFGIVPYLGQWGKGWIVLSHDQKSYVHAKYILLRRNYNG